jgi:hypothetical protein
MATYRPEYNNIDSLLDWFDNQNKCSWFIYHNNEKHIVDEYTGTDFEESASRLILCLNRLKSNLDNTNIYVLKIKPKTAKDETPRAIFQLNKNASLNGFPAQYPMQPANNEILSRLAAIESKLDDYDEDEDQDEQPATPGSILAGILQKPEVLNGITNFVLNMAGNFATPKVKAVAGINEENINDILKTLYSKGVKVEHLKKLSEMPEAKIQMLISML